MKNIIGVLLFSIGMHIVSFAMDLITERETRFKILDAMEEGGVKFRE